GRVLTPQASRLRWAHEGHTIRSKMNDMSAPSVVGPRNNGLRMPWGTITAFLLPALTVYVPFTAYPAFRTIWNSFHKVLPRREEMVGIANYVELLGDDIFWRAVRNTIMW